MSCGGTKFSAGRGDRMPIYGWENPVVVDLPSPGER